MRASVGTWASHGCIRMLNEDVIDLAARVEVGTKVFVIN
jgi:lipoprotein-anchoring transpeptidase ErfK/SrfK